MTYVKVAKTSDVAPGQIIPIAAQGHNLLLTNVDGQYYALASKCTHMGADLCGGKLENGAIICPKHGAAFDVASGEPVAPAKILFMKMKAKPLASYAVKVEGDSILVDAS